MTSYHITVDSESNCILCACDGWLPIPVGKISDFNSLEDVWNSPIAKMLQNDIDQKKFTWCAVEHCGVTTQSINRTQYSLSINIDDSCNLSCPSCRRELIMLDQGPEFEKKVEDLNRILEWLEKFDHPITVSLGGSGDPLASKIIRNLIKNYCYNSKQEFRINTNGLLLKKVIAESSIKSAVSIFSVSVDAGSKEIYEQVRRPGKWSVLMDNLEWLFDNQAQSTVHLSFVLQKTNFQDLPAFAELCKRFKFIGIVQPLNDWGTWNSKPVINPDAYTIVNGTYLDHDVANSDHPEHDEFIKVLKTVREKNFEFLNFNSYFDKFNINAT
jgi:sulfatase maturation enzyme AslB (radical SAM superfamily)